MDKTLYAIKLNQNLNKYLACTNTTVKPSAFKQDIFDYAILFDFKEDTSDAIEAYMSSPTCKMTKANEKFITIEEVEVEYQFSKFPIIRNYYIKDTSLLNNKDYNVFNRVYIEFNGFKGYAYICTRAYSQLM